MGADSAIQWTHHTFNPWRGCTKVSPGCEHCYAETLSKRNPSTLGTWGPGGTRVVAAESYWRQPLRWNRDGAGSRARRRVFCASLADVFEDWRGHVLDSEGNVLWRDPKGAVIRAGLTPVGNPIEQGYRTATLEDVRVRLFRLIEQTPHLDWLLLTKRPENMARFALPDWARGWPSNVWAMTTVENQAEAERRLPHLLAVPASVRGLSVEPLVGPVSLRIPFSRFAAPGNTMHGADGLYVNALRGVPGDHPIGRVHWVIVGGESGPGARPCDVAWIRDVVRQCREAGVPVFVKQLGARPHARGATTAGGPAGAWRLRDAKGGSMVEWPEDLRVREFPAGAAS